MFPVRWFDVFLRNGQDHVVYVCEMMYRKPPVMYVFRRCGWDANNHLVIKEADWCTNDRALIEKLDRLV